MESLKWSNGEKCLRTKREVKNTINRNIDCYDINTLQTIENGAYSSSLNYDENTWDILNQDIYNGFKRENRREELDFKISNRQMVQQIGYNPFMANNNYIDDISNRDKFLKPLNTNLDNI